MPAYVRDGGEWKDTVPFARSGGAWTDADDELYVRDGGEWKLIYPETTAGSGLLPVTGLAVTSGPTANSVTIGWTNPTQPLSQPTNVQYRIAALGAVWTEVDYPATSAAWGALTPNTTYVAQVRLVRRVNGVVTVTSTTEQVEFTTLTASVGEPAPDPGGSGGDTIIPINISTGGTPSPPGTNDGCWWEWKLEILNILPTTWIDTAISGEAHGDSSEDVSYDASLLDPTRIYRLCIREACDTNTDGVADTFGDWECGSPFPGTADWGAACAGVSDSVQTTGFTFAGDYIYRFPRLCTLDGGTRTGMIEAVSGTEIAKGTNFYSWIYSADDDLGVVSGSGFGSSMVAAAIADLPTLVAQGQDGSFGLQFQLSPSHVLNDGAVHGIESIAAGTINFRITESATGITPSVQIVSENGIMTLTGTELPNDDTIHTFVLTWDADGTKIFYVDSVAVDTDTSGDDYYETTTSTGIVTSGPDFSVVYQSWGIDRVLTPAEVAEYGRPPDPLTFRATIPSVMGVTTAGSVEFDHTNAILYIGNGGASTISSWDVSDPDSPSLIQTLAVTGFVGQIKLVTSSLLVYTTGTSDGIGRVTVTSGGAMTAAGKTTGLNDMGWESEIGGSGAYLITPAWTGSVVRVRVVTNANPPVAVGFVDITECTVIPRDVTKLSETLFAIGSFDASHFAIVDISTPSSPTYTAYTQPQHAMTKLVNATQWFGTGLRLMNNDGTLEKSWTVDLAGTEYGISGYDLDAHGDWLIAFGVAATTNYQLINIANPVNPVFYEPGTVAKTAGQEADAAISSTLGLVAFHCPADDEVHLYSFTP